MYTNPCWFCMVLWIFFFFVILSGFSECAYKFDAKNINHISETQAKDEYSYKPPNQIVVNQSNSEFKSKEENSKIISTEAESDDMVKKEIQELINDEDKAFSYMGTSFLILLFILLVIRVMCNII